MFFTSVICVSGFQSEESQACSLERNILISSSPWLWQSKMSSLNLPHFCGFPRVTLYASLDGCLSPCCVCTPLLPFADCLGPSQLHSVLLLVSLSSQHGDISVSQLFYIAGRKPIPSSTSWEKEYTGCLPLLYLFQSFQSSLINARWGHLKTEWPRPQS